ncbi:hypothetical protein SH580_16330 [Coraliomargarita algicola]|uniref:Sulfotransferase domain-containing protein n=1 Tax=Coraliomargarita algicola TaxID=3092156 RepID=A0ABZ0RI01_9BACT|nr:hypothetical protein [Coraliomargarita sp. J2-16]WPJ94996.1 hypothetical protein SH580_16330 [Coraliomargarita sp. J2-16]
MKNSKNTIGFATGSGRCGTNFLAKLYDQPNLVKASHERSPLNDTFHRYCKWYGVDVDPAGFIAHRQRFIDNDLSTNDFSFEASPFLALSLVELVDAFDCRIVVLVRHPSKVVSSYLSKDWYSEREIRTNSDLPPSFQKSRYFHHFLGRISPVGSEFIEWNDLTRVGKLAWYWKMINIRLLEQIEILGDRVSLVRLEDFDFDRACETHRFLGLPGELDQAHFNSVNAAKPNSLPQSHPVEAWTDREWSEFSKYVTPLAGRLNYILDRPKARQSTETLSREKTHKVSAQNEVVNLASWRSRIRAGISVALKGNHSPYLKKPDDLDLLRRI